jgi:hypothetical protein
VRLSRQFRVMVIPWFVSLVSVGVG